MLVLWFGLYSHFGRPVTKTLRLYLCDICVCEWCIMNEIFSSLSLQRSIFFSRLFQSIRSLSLTSLNCPLKLLVDLYVGEALLISICVIFLCFNLCFHFTFLSSINRFGVLYAAFFCAFVHKFIIFLFHFIHLCSECECCCCCCFCFGWNWCCDKVKWNGTRKPNKTNEQHALFIFCCTQSQCSQMESNCCMAKQSFFSFRLPPSCQYSMCLNYNFKH